MIIIQTKFLLYSLLFRTTDFIDYSPNNESAKKMSCSLKTNLTENYLKQIILNELHQILTKENDDLLERAYFERKIRFLTKELFLLNRDSIEELQQLELLNNQSNHNDINNQRIRLILTMSNSISKFK
jgi:hypothetical protein